MLHGCVRQAVSLSFVKRSAFPLLSSTLASTSCSQLHSCPLASHTFLQLHRKQLNQSHHNNVVTAAPSSLRKHRFLNRRTYASIAVPDSSSSQSNSSRFSEPLHAQSNERRAYKKQRRRYRSLYALAVVIGTTTLGYYFIPPVRSILIAIERCIFVGLAVGGCIWDYKLLFRKDWKDPAVRHKAYKTCHSELNKSIEPLLYERLMLSLFAIPSQIEKCAERILAVLKRNGGIYVKLGQHLSSVQLLPEEWSSTMKPLQDHCFPTPINEVQALFLRDVGEPIEALFSSFNPIPIGVASLAQVHTAIDRLSGRRVAVKIMHPDLQEFMYLDMKTTTLMLKVVKAFFPSFEFSWLGEEMEQNLPSEMDFRNEAANAKHCVANFSKMKHTSLVVPDVLWSQERILVMEYIEGGRVDDLEYLRRHRIDRNQVSCEISNIFSQMLFIDGSFHGDPHPGNLLIRPIPLSKVTRSKYNFEIVLLDHGLWFDISKALRTNYARLWLSLLQPKSEKVDADRRKYAQLVGNIGPDLFPIFEAAITGRAGGSEDETDENKGPLRGTLDGSLMGLAVQTPEEAQRLRNAFMQEGMLASVFELLRKVPRRLLMVLKINDLTRALDKSLNPSHPVWRVWIIVARYCCLAAYIDDLDQLKSTSSPNSLRGFSLYRAQLMTWLSFEVWYRGLGVVEFFADRYAKWVKMQSWFAGFIQGGWKEAHDREAGLVPLV